MAARVTLLDVARHAGVSRATASYVVMGTGRVSEATRTRVRQSMAELGYVYHQGAASLRRQGTRNVGVIVTNIDRPFFGEVLIGLESTLTANGYMSLVASTRDDLTNQAHALRMLRENQVAALAIIPATGTGADLVEAVREWGVPAIYMTRRLRDFDVPYVGPDDVAGGRLAAEHLIGHGCATLAYAGGPEPVVSRWDRIQGMRQAIDAAAARVGFEEIRSASTGQGGLEVGRELAVRDVLPEGILCHNDAVAMGLDRALYDAGRREETRIIGYDDSAAAPLWKPALTSVATNAYRIGEFAGRSLLDVVTGAADAVPSQLEEPRLAVRESCGAHPS